MSAGTRAWADPGWGGTAAQPNAGLSGLPRLKLRLALLGEGVWALLGVLRVAQREPEVVWRAEIVLAAAQGLTNKAISERGLGSVQTVCLWRKRYAKYGIEGLMDEP